MVKIQEHLDKINYTKQQINNSKGQQRLQYLKHLHRLQKELNQCKIYLKEGYTWQKDK